MESSRGFSFTEVVGVVVSFSAFLSLRCLLRCTGFSCVRNLPFVKVAFMEMLEQISFKVSRIQTVRRLTAYPAFRSAFR